MSKSAQRRFRRKERINEAVQYEEIAEDEDSLESSSPEDVSDNRASNSVHEEKSSDITERPQDVNYVAIDENDRKANLPLLEISTANTTGGIGIIQRSPRSGISKNVSSAILGATVPLISVNHPSLDDGDAPLKDNNTATTPTVLSDGSSHLINLLLGGNTIPIAIDQTSYPLAYSDSYNNSNSTRYRTDTRCGYYGNTFSNEESYDVQGTSIYHTYSAADYTGVPIHQNPNGTIIDERMKYATSLQSYERYNTESLASSVPLIGVSAPPGLSVTSLEHNNHFSASSSYGAPFFTPQGSAYPTPISYDGEMNYSSNSNKDMDIYGINYQHNLGKYPNIQSCTQESTPNSSYYKSKSGFSVRL